MIIEDTVISFETAKLVKEKGFDERCYAFYMEDGSGPFRYTFTENHEGDFKLYNSSALLAKLNRYSAPTQSLLQRWLREKHNIHLSMDVGINAYFCYYRNKAIGNLPSNIDQGWVNDEDNPCKTYEGALELGLQQALKLI